MRTKKRKNTLAYPNVAGNEACVLIVADAHGLKGEVQQGGLTVFRVVLYVVHAREVGRCHHILKSKHTINRFVKKHDHNDAYSFIESSPDFKGSLEPTQSQIVLGNVVAQSHSNGLVI